MSYALGLLQMYVTRGPLSVLVQTFANRSFELKKLIAIQLDSMFCLIK